MTYNALVRRAVSLAAQAFRSDDDLLYELQITLAALADIGCRHEMDRERLIERFGPDAVNQPFWIARERRCRAEREPHLRKLERLQQRMRRGLFSGL